MMVSMASLVGVVGVVGMVAEASYAAGGHLRLAVAHVVVVVLRVADLSLGPLGGEGWGDGARGAADGFARRHGGGREEGEGSERQGVQCRSKGRRRAK